MQAGTEMGLALPTVGGAISSGIQQGMQMANTVASFQDKYGADAQAAKERKAQMETLQIQSAQQQLTQGDLRTQQMQAEQPYFGVRAANEAQLSSINLEVAKLNQTRQEATVANLPTEIGLKNTEMQIGITDQTLTLADKQRAMDAELAKKNDLQAWSTKLSSATTPDEFVAVRKELNAYWGKNGLADYDKLSAQFALEARAKGVASDPQLSGYLNSGSPITIAGIEKSMQTYTSLAKKTDGQLNAWAENYHNGGSFATNPDGTPRLAEDGKTPVKAEDWSAINTAAIQNFSTPVKDASGNVVIGADRLPVMSTPNVNDVMTNIQFVGANEKGELVFKNTAKADANTFAVSKADGNKFLQLIQLRDNSRRTTEAIAIGSTTLDYMNKSGKTMITPDEKQRIAFETSKSFLPQPVESNDGPNPILPPDNEGRSAQQQLEPHIQDWIALQSESPKSQLEKDVLTGRLEALKNKAPEAYAEVVRLGAARINQGSSGKTVPPGAKTPASYYAPLP